MKKLLSIGLGVALVAAFAATSFAAPSRAIVQELGAVAANGEVNIDINTTVNTSAAGISSGILVVPAGSSANGATLALAAQLNAKAFVARVGTLGGEVRISNNSIGYKVPVGPAGLAVYGDLGFGADSFSPAAVGVGPTGTTRIAVGAAYTFNPGVILNINPEYVMISNSYAGAAPIYNNNMLNINAAVLFPITPSLIVGGELLYSTFGWSATPTAGATTGATTFALGGRYLASANVTIDLALYAATSTSIQGGGTAPTFSSFGTPVVAKVNIKL